MKRTMVRTTFGIILLVAMGGVATTAVARSCTLGNTAGEYGYTSNGTIVTPPVGPFATVGHVTFTASGAFSGVQTTSIAGNFFDETVSGTYTVNPDCTGTAVVNVYHGTTLARTSNLSLVWDDNRSEIRAIFLTPGTVITIRAKKMFREEEED
jgi:hypothetical protein